MDPNPFPGLSVSPLHGVIPVGGTAELQVHLTPNAVIKFDTRVQVAIRGSRTLELRMGGTVEPPVIEVDLVSGHRDFMEVSHPEYQSYLPGIEFKDFS